MKIKKLKIILFSVGAVILVALISITSWVLSNWRDRHPDYSVDLQIDASDITKNIKVGFAKMPATRTVPWK